MQRHTITLDHPTDWPGFRQAARALVQANVPPQAVDWRCQADAAEDLFAPEPAASHTLPSPAPDAQHDAGVLDCCVRIQQLGTHGADARTAGLAHQFLQPVVRDHLNVVVEEAQHVPGGL